MSCLTEINLDNMAEELTNLKPVSVEPLNEDVIRHELFDATERGINWAVTSPESINPGHLHG